MRKVFTPFVSLLLFIIAGLQAFRATKGFDLIIGQFHVPVFASWIACGIALFLSVMLFLESRT